MLGTQWGNHLFSCLPHSVPTEFVSVMHRLGIASLAAHFLARTRGRSSRTFSEQFDGAVVVGDNDGANVVGDAVGDGVTPREHRQFVSPFV